MILLIPLIFILPHIFSADSTMAIFLAEPIADTLAVATTVTTFGILFSKYLKGGKAERLPVGAEKTDFSEGD